MRAFIKTLCALFVVAWTVACSLLENKHEEGTARSRTERSDSTGTVGQETTPYDTIIYTAGVRFRDGYDWRLDTLVASEPRELVLYKDGELLLSFETGEDQMVSADPDMHRIIDGHLYTDYVTSKQTVVKRDGEVLFRFDGREIFCGFMVDGTTVWTLSKDRMGDKSFNLRKNGELVYSDIGVPIGLVSDPSGEPFALSIGSNGPNFFYYRTFIEPDRKERNIYYFNNYCANLIQTPENMTYFLDAKMVNGRSVVAGQMGTSNNVLTLYLDNHTESYNMAGMSKLVSAYILPTAGNNYVVTGEGYSGADRTPVGFVLEEDHTITYYDGDTRLIGYYDKDDLTVTVTCKADGSSPVINKNGWTTNVEGRYCYISKRCGRICGKRFYMAFTPLDKGSTPFVIGGNKRLDLNFNGFVTDVCISVVPRSER